MATQSTMVELGTPARSFRLPDAVSGKTVALEDFASSTALLVAFICNHCPYVKHIMGGLVSFANDYRPRGLTVIAISSNDVVHYPADSPAEMAKLARDRGFAFPYLYDESQSVAHAYDAACTPDFYLFDRNRLLAYRGQFDGSRPNGKVPVTGGDLRAAADAVLLGQAVSIAQIPSVGCGIKWKAGG